MSLRRWGLRQRLSIVVGATAILGVLVPLTYSAPAGAAQFCNTTPIVFTVPPGPVQDIQRLTPFPSPITVSGLTGTVTDVNITLNNLTYPNPSDLDVLLVSPDGTNVIVMSDVGGTPDLQFSVSNVNLTFDDQAAANAPTNSQLASGTFKPTDDDGDAAEFTNTDTFTSVLGTFTGPTPSAATALSVFNGKVPNGVWNLYVVDDEPGPPTAGQFAGGWCIDVLGGGSGGTTTSTTAGPTTTSTTTTLPTTTTTSTTVSPSTSTTSSTTTTTLPTTTTTSTTTTTTTSTTTTSTTSTTTTSTTTTTRPTTTTTSTTTTTLPTTTTSSSTTSTTRATTTTTVPAGTCGGLTPTIVGTAGDDAIYGTSGPDVIVGNGGNDRIFGNGGNDVICGGAGNDLIYAGPGGNTRLFGDAGNDRLVGNQSNDAMDGGPDFDQCTGQGGTDTFVNCEG